MTIIQRPDAHSPVEIRILAPDAVAGDHLVTIRVAGQDLALAHERIEPMPRPCNGFTHMIGGAFALKSAEADLILAAVERYRRERPRAMLMRWKKENRLTNAEAASLFGLSKSSWQEQLYGQSPVSRQTAMILALRTRNGDVAP